MSDSAVQDAQHKRFKNVPRQKGKLLELLHTVNLRPLAPANWGPQDQIEAKIQSCRHNDVIEVLRELKMGTLQFVVGEV